MLLKPKHVLPIVVYGRFSPRSNCQEQKAATETNKPNEQSPTTRDLRDLQYSQPSTLAQQHRHAFSLIDYSKVGQSAIDLLIRVRPTYLIDPKWIEYILRSRIGKKTA